MQQAALEAYKDALRSKKRDPDLLTEARYHRGKLLLELGKTSQAMKDLETVCAADPHHEDVADLVRGEPASGTRSLERRERSCCAVTVTRRRGRHPGGSPLGRADSSRVDTDVDTVPEMLPAVTFWLVLVFTFEWVGASSSAAPSTRDPRWLAR